MVEVRRGGLRSRDFKKKCGGFGRGEKKNKGKNTHSANKSAA